MRVFVTGGTGSIGAAVVPALVGRHDVLGLARSTGAARRLQELGASVLQGDIGDPQSWINALPPIDAVVHMAADFSDAMGAVEARLLDALLPALGTMPKRPRFLYTGGCWLFGATGDTAATESSPFDPLPAFAWMVPHLQRVCASRDVDGLVVHPAMVWREDGGVLRGFLDDARHGRPVTVVGSEQVRWPLVHADDLATLYALVLERAERGSVYNGAAVDGIAVGTIARAIARYHGAGSAGLRIITPDQAAAARGAWARGYALDQRMSGAKAQRELGWQPVHPDPVASLDGRSPGITK